MIDISFTSKVTINSTKASKDDIKIGNSEIIGSKKLVIGKK